MRKAGAKVVQIEQKTKKNHIYFRFSEMKLIFTNGHKL